MTLTPEELQAIRAIVREELAGRAQAPAPAPSSSGAAFKFGRSKGTPLATGSAKDLRWYGEAIARSLADPGKAQWRDSNQRDLDTINELLRRLGEGPVGGAAPTVNAATQSILAPDFGGDEEIPF